MRFMMSPAEYATQIRRAPWYFFGGVAVLTVGFFSHHFITFAGFMAVALGASARGMNEDMLRQPLMWIVSGLLWLICLLMYGCMAYLEVWQLASGGRESVWAGLGLAASTSVLWLQSRLLFTFTRINWRATR